MRDQMTVFPTEQELRPTHTCAHRHLFVHINIPQGLIFQGTKN